MSLGTSKTKLLTWTGALPLSKLLGRTSPCHPQVSSQTKWHQPTAQTSCCSLEDMVAPGLLYTSAGHQRVEVGVQDQRACSLCSLSHH